jgi:lysophospholipase L1-like esterase
MKKNLLFISITFNILFLLFGGYVINKKGGIDYLKIKLNIQKENVNQNDYGPYYNAKKSIFEIMPNDISEIIFLGNSITDYCDWYELFGKSNIKNRGIGGDVINGVIDRLDEVVESKPQKIFLMIGINDLGRKSSVNQILIDYEKLINEIIEKAPDTELYIQSVLPTDNRERLQNTDVIIINNGLIELTKKYNLTYINLFDLFKTTENKLNPAMTFDGLHVNGQGYLIWKNAIIEYVNK